MALLSATLTVIGPRILGHATDVLFRGAAASFFNGGGPLIDFARLHHYLYIAIALYGITIAKVLFSDLTLYHKHIYEPTRRTPNAYAVFC